MTLVTPSGVALSSEVDRVSLPGVAGRFTVLRGHAPIVSALTAGVVEYGNESITIEGGIVHVKEDKVSVFAQRCAACPDPTAAAE